MERAHDAHVMAAAPRRQFGRLIAAPLALANGQIGLLCSYMRDHCVAACPATATGSQQATHPRLALLLPTRHGPRMSDAPSRPALALIEPDIAGNTGTLLRTAACFAVPIHIVEPCGFAFGERALRRAGMDYAADAALTRHSDRESFLAAMAAEGRRTVLLTTAGAEPIDHFTFTPVDVLMLGSEAVGAATAPSFCANIV